MITSKTPKLDLHGEISSMVEVLVNDFINYNYILKIDTIIIIHGISSNILSNEVERVLKKNKQVKSFKKNNWNLGETIVQLNIQ